ncbi:GDSL esterase/lipase At3g09930-like [Papaver somniferum]|uniref:GDSL esterase/lipase At3g09930-like n=1 Tax=Papaver somniferum TaxID=3469 RepID=UPI000E6F9CB8|nr:GDSL esterase/lipase At3g09930-like [Papaver somniferum]
MPFLASFMGIKSPMPYTQLDDLSKTKVSNGMNFAHGGTGVFNTWMKKEPNMTIQIDTFKQYIADGVYTKSDLDESMAVVSSSGNDYTQYNAVYHGTHEGYQAFVAKVIDQLELNIREIKKTGVNKVVMLTMQPLGCLPYKEKTLSYEKCDKPLNNDTIYHNTFLQKAVQRLNKETTDSPFHILDLYSAFMSVINKRGGGANNSH